ncbi:MAG: adenylate/guanylate cyclase domain-containing protein [bacterium]|nr:adenylate/guanylate cyclase domain-containing protein [bacterium]
MAILVIATDFVKGFADIDLKHFTKIASVLTPIVEVLNLKQVSRAVAKAYLGARTGQRVLAGQITRGHIEKINAAILVSDIRDWTGLNNRLGSEAALALANRYFEIIAGAVETNEGEILKFVGDGVLAIFPEGESLSSGQVCENALSAGRQALQTARETDPPLDLRFGIGMHVGEVLYGNIGSLTRIDFTVLGQAVNIAARIEGLCSKFDKQILFSQEFANLLEVSTELVAKETLKGQNSASSILTTREDP